MGPWHSTLDGIDVVEQQPIPARRSSANANSSDRPSVSFGVSELSKRDPRRSLPTQIAAHLEVWHRL